MKGLPAYRIGRCEMTIPSSPAARSSHHYLFEPPHQCLTAVVPDDLIVATREPNEPGFAGRSRVGPRGPSSPDLLRLKGSTPLTQRAGHRSSAPPLPRGENPTPPACVKPSVLQASWTPRATAHGSPAPTLPTFSASNFSSLPLRDRLQIAHWHLHCWLTHRPGHGPPYLWTDPCPGPDHPWVFGLGSRVSGAAPATRCPTARPADRPDSPTKRLFVIMAPAADTTRSLHLTSKISLHSQTQRKVRSFHVLTRVKNPTSMLELRHAPDLEREQRNPGAVAQTEVTATSLVDDRPWTDRPQPLSIGVCESRSIPSSSASARVSAASGIRRGGRRKNWRTEPTLTGPTCRASSGVSGTCLSSASPRSRRRWASPSSRCFAATNLLLIRPPNRRRLSSTSSRGGPTIPFGGGRP